MKSIFSYNVNGIRAAWKKGLGEWIQEASPDVLCIQELKAQIPDANEEILAPEGYLSYWHAAEKRGYSGVAIYTKEEPKHVEYGCGIDRYDKEGRVIRADFNDYSVMSVYVPSGTTGDIRQTVKEEFMDDFFEYIQDLKKSIPNLVISGDFNICHREIDIHNPVSNKNSSGFLPHEREWVSKFLEGGFKDSFRMFNEDPHHYTWWSFRANARANNKGWRIDYHMVSDPFAERCENSIIHPDVIHSDHCPLELQISS